MDGVICSLIVAARNEEAFIDNCLESLENQSLDRLKYEIIVVDGMSEDSTVKKVKGIQKLYGNIILLDNPHKTASAGFNSGVQHSRGKYVFILGAHAWYSFEFVEKSINSLEKNGVDCVGGRVVYTGGNKIGEIFGIVRNTAFGGGLSPYRYSCKMQYVKTVAFGCYKKEALTGAGGFDEKLVKNQDNDLNKRMVSSGSKILFDPGIESYYHTRNSLKSMFRQMFGYGFWEARLIKMRTGQMSPATLMPVLLVIYTIAALAVLIIKGAIFPLLAEIILYLTVFSYFAIRAVVPKRKNVLTALFLYMLIHFSIGIGFITGLAGKTKK